MRDKCAVKELVFTERSNAAHYIQLLGKGIEKLNQTINCPGTKSDIGTVSPARTGAEG